MKVDPATPAAPSLRWRIPTGTESSRQRSSPTSILLTTLIAAIVVAFTSPPQQLPWSLAAIGCISVALVLWRRRAPAALAENVWLDDGGVHWQVGDQVYDIPRPAALAFRIAREADTLRDVPALTFYLADAFESQPLELHPPATLAAVRQLLMTEWQLPESAAPPSSADDADRYDIALDLYSECHEDTQDWHFEGAVAVLETFCAELERAAKELPLAPLGAKPAQRVVLAQRRVKQPVRIQRCRQAALTPAAISGPPEFLLEFSRRLRSLAAGDGVQPVHDDTCEIAITPRKIWRLHWHGKSLAGAAG